MRSVFGPACVGTVLAALAGSAAAQAPSDAQTADKVRYETVVTASRTETPLANAPIATEVISRTEIERTGSRDVSEVLATHPGVQLARSFNGVTVTLQGLDSQYVLVLIDGQRVIGRVNGGIDLSRLPIDDIERIEIVRGPSSVLYGADAIGGVINIITRRARRKYEADGSASYGTLNTTDLRAGAGLKRDSWSAHVSGGYHRRDAYRLDPTTLATSGSAYGEFEFGGRAEYHSAQRFKLLASADYLQRRQRGVDAAATGAVFDRQNVIETLSAQVAPEIQLRPTARLRINASYSLYRSQYLSDQRGSNALDQYQSTREQLIVLGLQHDHVLPAGHYLSAGFEGRSELLDSDRLVGGHGLRWRGAVFAQDQWTIAKTPRLVVVPAVRVDLDSQFGHAISPKIAVRFDPTRRLILRASYGRGFRPPSFQELLIRFENPSVGYVVDGNQKLRPETSDGINVGFELRATRWLWASANFYRNNLKNLIGYAITDPGGAGSPVQYQYVNIASAHTQGVETSVRLQPSRDLNLDVGYTLTDSEDEVRKRPLEGRARHAGNFLVGFYRKAWGFEATVRGAVFGPRPYYTDLGDGTVQGGGAYQTTRTATYVQLDARVAETLPNWRHITLFVGVQNILGAGDAKYTPLPPRTFYGGVAARY